MRTSTAISAAILTLALAIGCSTTRIVESWQAPGLSPSDLAFEHVVAIAITPNASQQRIAEDALARSATRTRVSPAYTLLDDAVRADTEQVRAALTAAGIDGAIVVRLISSQQKQTWVPGQVVNAGPGGFYGYYGRASTVIYDPGYMRTDSYVRIETSLHDVAGGKLLWSAISETMNPSSLDSLMQEIVEAAGDELREQGLVP